MSIILCHFTRSLQQINACIQHCKVCIDCKGTKATLHIITDVYRNVGYNKRKTIENNRHQRHIYMYVHMQYMHIFYALSQKKIRQQRGATGILPCRKEFILSPAMGRCANFLTIAHLSIVPIYHKITHPTGHNPMAWTCCA